jgi:Ca2+-binding EF-hand superfamily protein
MKKHCLSALIVGSGLALAGTALAGPDCGGKAGKGAAERFERLDANKDGKVTLAELTQSKESWLGKMDANKDGVATAAEVQQSHEAMRAERVTRMFEKRDADKDGRLTSAESQMPERWFARSDANNDGALTVAELAARPARGKGDQSGKSQGKRGGGQLAHLDQNDDGKVERDEVRQAATRMLERLDRNADGSLTSEELGRGGAGHGKGPHRGGSEGKNVKPIKS